MPITLAQHLESAAEPGLAELLKIVADACVDISALVRRGAAGEVLGALETENVQGEVQKKLDVISNDVLLEASRQASRLMGVASEELDHAEPLRPLDGAPGYLLLFDPLDGSSNIDVNVSIGTIFSILPAPDGAGREVTDEDFLQNGRRQVAAGYAVYGPQTTLVLTTGDGVRAFTLDPRLGDWLLVSEQVQVAHDTKEYAINASNMRHWAQPVRTYVEECLAGEGGPRGKNFNMRWVGSMVADVHRILMRGGVFLYPWDAREPDRAGKLRLMYEANPMAFLMEQAGGASFDSHGLTLDAAVTGLHQRVSVMMGSAAEVERLQSLHAQSARAEGLQTA